MEDEPTTVWNRPERGARGPAPERSRAQITAEAVAVADEGGLAAVSMRQVARRLGTGPASLYRYVSTRADLLDLMADAVSGEIDLDVALTGDPVEDLAALASRAKRTHLDHPWLLDLPTEPVPGPRGMDYLEYALRALEPTRLAHPARLETIGLVNGLVTLFARTEIRRAATEGDSPSRTRVPGAAATPDRHPLVTAALAASPGADQDTHVLFERMVRRVLTGLVEGP
ncbi:MULTISPECIES: TetR/AcrR family transcriptional regulator [unclassified Nocardiopsis]|uniref:TetR/AcrR family transcriptional regulator n=1 Tax=unclassified Nocardiopsis TaxID=2649073 RepID=UPI0033C87CB3